MWVLKVKKQNKKIPKYKERKTVNITHEYGDIDFFEGKLINLIDILNGYYTEMKSKGYNDIYLSIDNHVDYEPYSKYTYSECKFKISGYRLENDKEYNKRLEQRERDKKNKNKLKEGCLKLKRVILLILMLMVLVIF